MRKVNSIIVALFMALMPIVFLPNVLDQFGFGKQVVVMVMGMVMVLLWLVEMIINRKSEMKINGVSILMVLGLLWAGFLWLRLPAGVQMNSLINVGGLGTLLTAGLWWWIWLQYSEKEEREQQLNWLSVSGLVVAVVSLVVFLIPSGSFPIAIPNKESPWLVINGNWSLVGGLLSEVVLMVFLALEWVRRLLKQLKDREDYIKTAIMTAVLVLMTSISIFRIVKTGWVALDGQSGWVIATETFKRSPFLGVGTGNFYQAFNLFRPASYNTTPYWTNAFGISSNGILHWWTELGMGALIVMAVWLMAWVKRKKDFNWLRLLIIGGVVILTPVNLMGVLLAAWLMANYLTKINVAKPVFKIGEMGFNGTFYILGLILVPIILFGGYWMTRIVIADSVMRRALVAASKNDGGTTYNLQIEAIGLNPVNGEYRKLYSQTNMALAKTLLANESISDEDKQKATVLIQQAVREGKAAVALDQGNPTYWSNLAVIYKDLIGVVDGAADWSYEAYTQAAGLDGVNPLVRMDLGGLLFAAGRVEESERVFEQVVTNKQDYANGWYNWAYAAKKLNKLGDAVSRLNQAVALVPKDSGDYEKANEELNTWKKEYDEALKKFQEQQKNQQAQEKKAETLKTPEALPTGEEKVNVNGSDLEPPEAVVTPTPSGE